MAITATSTVAMVREKFPQAVVETVNFRGEETIVLLPEHLLTVCGYLLKNQQYTFLSSVTAVDWLEREPRYDVVYHLLSIPNQSELRLKVRVGLPGEEHPSVPTVSGIWPGANWFEREVYDLFGIIFSGHPDLRRILMPIDWIGEVRFRMILIQVLVAKQYAHHTVVNLMKAAANSLRARSQGQRKGNNEDICRSRM